jgi:GntR family transcriptional regulator
MTPFRFTLAPGEPIFDQVVFAATKAFVSGELKVGDPFPSVRALAADLKIHPNTAHKVIQHLIGEKWLEARPGLGTVVAPRPEAAPEEREKLLHDEVEALVVGAKSVGLSEEELVAAVRRTWKRLKGDGQ